MSLQSNVDTIDFQLALAYATSYDFIRILPKMLKSQRLPLEAAACSIARGQYPNSLTISAACWSSTESACIVIIDRVETRSMES